MKVRLQGYTARDADLTEFPVPITSPQCVKVALLITDDRHIIEHFVDVTDMAVVEPQQLDLLVTIVGRAIDDAEARGAESARAAIREALGLGEGTL